MYINVCQFLPLKDQVLVSKLFGGPEIEVIQAFILIFDECNLPHVFRPTCVNMMKQKIHCFA